MVFFLVMSGKLWNGQMTYEIADEDETFWVSEEELKSRLSQVRDSNLKKRLKDSIKKIDENVKKNPHHYSPHRESHSTSDDYLALKQRKDNKFQEFMYRMGHNRPAPWQHNPVIKKKSCSKKKKSRCKSPCRWVSGKGCRR